MKKTAILLISVFLVTLACLPSFGGCEVRSGTHETRREGEWRCSPVPKTFQESDLIGVWQARYHTGLVTDTITLREDNTYQQIYDDDLADYHYKSPWNKWYMEYRPSGGLYLHLEGMRYCLSISEVCRREGGGGGNWPYYDVCEDRSVRTMGNEVILTVRGSEEFRYPGIEYVPRGILLWQMRSSPDVSDHFFILRE